MINSGEKAGAKDLIRFFQFLEKMGVSSTLLNLKELSSSYFTFAAISHQLNDLKKETFSYLTKLRIKLAESCLRDIKIKVEKGIPVDSYDFETIVDKVGEKVQKSHLHLSGKLRQICENVHNGKTWTLVTMKNGISLFIITDIHGFMQQMNETSDVRELKLGYAIILDTGAVDASILAKARGFTIKDNIIQRIERDGKPYCRAIANFDEVVNECLRLSQMSREHFVEEPETYKMQNTFSSKKPSDVKLIPTPIKISFSS